MHAEAQCSQVQWLLIVVTALALKEIVLISKFPHPEVPLQLKAVIEHHMHCPCVRKVFTLSVLQKRSHCVLRSSSASRADAQRSPSDTDRHGSRSKIRAACRSQLQQVYKDFCERLEDEDEEEEAQQQDDDIEVQIGGESGAAPNAQCPLTMKAVRALL